MMQALERIPVGRRLLLIAVSFSAPIGVMLWLIISGMNANIAFAEAERQGVQYLAPLSALLASVGADLLLLAESFEELRIVDGGLTAIAEVTQILRDAGQLDRSRLI